MKGHAVTLQILFGVEFIDGEKWKKHIPVLFSGDMAQLMNFMRLLIFPFKGGGRVSCHPRSGKTEVITRELERQQARDM